MGFSLVWSGVRQGLKLQQADVKYTHTCDTHTSMRLAFTYVYEYVYVCILYDMLV